MDDFNAAGLEAFGPTKAAGAWSGLLGFLQREIMVKYDVPTAAYVDFQIEEWPSRKECSIVVRKTATAALRKGVVALPEMVEQAVKASHGCFGQ